MVKKMASSDVLGDGGEGSREERAKRPYMQTATQCLMLIKQQLTPDVYKEFLDVLLEFKKQSIPIEECKEAVLKVLDGQAQVIKGFQNFTEGRSPFHGEGYTLEDTVSFFVRLKKCPLISADDYNAFVNTLVDFHKSEETMTVRDILQELKGVLINCPELLEEFKTYLPPHLRDPLPDEQSCTSLKTTPAGNAINKRLEIQVKDTNHSSKVPQLKYSNDENQDMREHNFRQKQPQRFPDSVTNPRKGSAESRYCEGNKVNKAEPLLQWSPSQENEAELLLEWSPSRENELPPKVDLSNCTHYTPSYCLLPKICMTLQSSCQNELGRSVLNDSLVSVTSGSEDCFKFRTKNQDEENMFKCEDDMFESDMLLQRFIATADFIESLQDRVGSNVKIQEHLNSIHRRCIERLYDDYGPDMLDALSENRNTSASLAVLLSRLNQKIEVLSEARFYLNKTCSDIITNNYYKSLDHRSVSFKQEETKRMSRKDLWAEANQINKTNSNTDVHIQEDMGSIVSYAYSRKYTTEDKSMMNWTELVKAFLSFKCQRPGSKDTIALKEACERCGTSKDFLSNIPDALLANEFALPAKGGDLRDKSNECTYVQDGDPEVEEGEFRPAGINVQLDAMLEPGKGAASYGAAVFCADGSSNTCKGSVCDHGNVDCNNEVESAAYFRSIAKRRDVKRGKTCCLLVELCRLLQIIYERLLIAKNLSVEASTTIRSRDACARDSYPVFKEKLCNLIDRTVDDSDFELFCLKFLGPKSYILFTLHMLIARVAKKVSKVYQNKEKSSKRSLSKDSQHHPTAIAPSTRSLEREGEEQKGGEPCSDTGKAKQHHFQRRKKRMLENSAASVSQPGAKKMNI